MQIASCFVEPGFFGEGRGVDDEYDAAQGVGVREGRGSIVAELAVAGRVEEEEAAGALEGWVAGRAVVG